jgi:hypothetical protein
MWVETLGSLPDNVVSVAPEGDTLNGTARNRFMMQRRKSIFSGTGCAGKSKTMPGLVRIGIVHTSIKNYLPIRETFNLLNKVIKSFLPNSLNRLNQRFLPR